MSGKFHLEKIYISYLVTPCYIILSASNISRTKSLVFIYESLVFVSDEVTHDFEISYKIIETIYYTTVYNITIYYVKQ